MMEQERKRGLYHVVFYAFLTSVFAATIDGVAARPFFVFGSSYVDTGNVQRSDPAFSYPWKAPYGETWPGNPSGRYSNGHVLTDILGTALNLSPPVSFSQRVPGMKYPSGINFGTGGSGVLSAYGKPAISSQIDKLQSVISSYTKEELVSAVVLYAITGDDYLYQLTVQNASLQDIYPLTVNVGKQISTDLIRIYGLGLRKFAVTLLPPIGCFPVATAINSFQRCSDSWNTNVADVHNARIFKNINGLKHYFTNGTIVVLDLYSAFPTSGSQQTLQPCCVGSTPKNRCSSVDAAGKPLYGLCSNPSSKFFWDDFAHPTESGWQAVVNKLQSSLSPLF